MTVYKAYISATGQLNAYVLTHDVKKCLMASTSPSGWLHILSTNGTTAVQLLENDSKIYKPLLQKAFNLFDDKTSEKKSLTSARRSGLGAPAFHAMASLFQKTLLLPFENGRLLTSVHQDIMALDFEPKPGRREFVLSILAESPPPQQGQR